MDPITTAPTPEPDEPSPQERLKRGETDAGDARHGDRSVFRVLAGPGSLRGEELRKAIGCGDDREAWKRLLWRLHNEGYLKVRWVGLVDPDPVEVRLTERGRAAIEGSGAQAAGARQPSAA